MFKQESFAGKMLRLLLCLVLVTAQVIPAAVAESLPPTTIIVDEGYYPPTTDTTTEDVVTDTGDTSGILPVVDGMPPVNETLPEGTVEATPEVTPQATATMEIMAPPVATEIPAAPAVDLPLISGDAWTRTDDTPMDVREVLTAMNANPASLINAFALAFTENGEAVQTPDLEAAIEMTLSLHLPEGVPAQLRQGDWYTINMPEGITLADGQTAGLMMDDVTFANVRTENGAIHVAFEGDIAGLTQASVEFAMQAAFQADAYGEGQAVTLSLPEEDAPAVTFTMAGTAPEETIDPNADADAILAAGDEAWTRTDDTPMNVKDIYTNLGLPRASIIKDIQLTYQDSGDVPPSSTDATIDAAIDFNMNIEIPEAVTSNMREGDTYTIDLPSDIRVVQGDTYELYGPDGSGVSYGTVVVGDDNRITITFHDAIRSLGDATGSFHFSAKFDKDSVGTPGDHEIVIPNEPDDTSVTVNIISDQQQALDKKGTVDKSYNPSGVTWDVDFNKPMQTLHGAMLTDTIPEGLTLDSVEVYQIGVDLDGNVIPGTETAMDSSQYTVDLATGTVVFTGPVSSAVRVRYLTSITGDTRVILKSRESSAISTKWRWRQGERKRRKIRQVYHIS